MTRNYCLCIIHVLELQNHRLWEYWESFGSAFGPKTGVKNINLAFSQKKTHQENLNRVNNDKKNYCLCIIHVLELQKHQLWEY